jgi:CRISPR/Cas system-associated protein endoribonuclease Cas2
MTRLPEFFVSPGKSRRKTSVLKTRRTRLYFGTCPMPILKKFLRRAAAVLFAVAVAGCQPRDPLDMKISAQSPDDFNRWTDTHDSRLPPEAAQEFHRAFARLQQGTLAGDSQGAAAALCRKLDGRTVRQVIADGYFMANTSIRRSILNELDNVQRNLARAQRPEASAQEVETLQELVKRQEAGIEKLRSQLTTNEWRLAQFAGTDAKL